MSEASGASGTASRRPTLMVATSWSEREPPLGLDRPLDLLGGEALAPDRLATHLALDWVPDLQDAAAEACMRRSLEGRPWFGMPPCVLTGDAGSGRGLAARRLARVAGVPLVRIDVSGPGGALRLHARAAPPDAALPSVVTLAMAAARCANPMVLVDGVDDAESRTLDLLRAASDPVTCRRWSESSIGATIDFGEVTWLIRSSTPLGPPRQLGGFRRLSFARHPDDDLARRCLELTVLSEAMSDAGAAPAGLGGRTGEVLERMAASSTADPARLAIMADHILATPSEPHE